MEKRYKSKIVVDLLLERTNKDTNKKEILLMLRQNTGYLDNHYDLPGGHIEPNEDIFGAMIREAKEELGIIIKREDMKIIHIYHQYKKDKLKFVFQVKKYTNPIKNTEPEKCQELKWVEIQKLPNNIIPILKKEITNIKNDIFYQSDNP